MRQLTDPARELVRDPMLRMKLRGRLLRPWWERRFAAFGEGTLYDKPEWLSGAHRITIGSGTLIFTGSVLSVDRARWHVEEPTLTIGDRVVFGRHVQVVALAGIHIADDVSIGAYTSVLDSVHHHEPHANVFYNPSTAEPITIGRGSWIAERCVVGRGVRIGKHCTIGANSVVREDIPDYAIAVGAPTRIVGSNREAVERAAAG